MSGVALGVQRRAAPPPSSTSSGAASKVKSATAAAMIAHVGVVEVFEHRSRPSAPRSRRRSTRIAGVRTSRADVARRRRHQGHLGAQSRGDFGEGVPLAARGAIGHDPHRIDGLAGPARADQHATSAQDAAVSLEDSLHQSRRSLRDRAAAPLPRRRRRGDRSRARGPSRRGGASVARFSWTEGCSHISVCIAGHSSTGARVTPAAWRSADRRPRPIA